MDSKAESAKQNFMHAPDTNLHQRETGRFLDLQTWPRQAHFHFFQTFADPNYNMCATVDVTSALQLAKANRLSFMHLTLFLSLKAANEVEEFRYRLRGDQVWVHDRIHPSCTLFNDDKSFSFCNFVWQPSWVSFNQDAQQARKHKFLPVAQGDVQQDRDDVIHCSVIPWLSFTNFTHPKSGRPDTGIPKLGFGKYFLEGERVKMPVSLDVSHVFIDGYHIGRFFEVFQQLLDDLDPSEFVA